MESRTAIHFTTIDETLEYVLQACGPALRMASPLGLGKPNQLINAIYRRIKTHPDKSLDLYTALSLDLPAASQDLEKALLNPFISRHFGVNYPAFEYVKDLKAAQLPKNISIHEFYFQAGQNKNVAQAQYDYANLNYTHVAPYLVEKNLNVVVQLIAKKEINGKVFYSLSCNPDLTLDIKELYEQHGKKFLMVGVIHPELPYIGHDAVVSEDFFDVLLDDPAIHPELFAIPRTPVKPTDYLIGLYASQLVEDDGTLQIGIGSLSEALVHSLCLRHKESETYHQAVTELTKDKSFSKRLQWHKGVFEKGLYGTSEMVMDGFMNLRQAGILKRSVHEKNKETPTYLNGAFFLGSKALYKWLNDLSAEDFAGINMTRVSKVNDLYDSDEKALRRQRKRARFFNTCMNVTLLGGAASDTLPDGQVISGVGGQYNFVAMAYELPDSHSVLMLRSTRFDGGKKVSNIVWSHGQLTIPRHLRDIVITEYGIADLKGKSDQEVIQELLNITDSEFQEALRDEAVNNGKLDPQYEIPEWALHNTSDHLDQWTHSHFFKAHFPNFPFGSDFTPEEERLVIALGILQKATSSPVKVVRLFLKGLKPHSETLDPYLDRMNLKNISGLKDWVYQKLVRAALIYSFDEEPH